MPSPLQRPGAPQSPPAGMLRGEHFQIAYATNDLARARRVMGERYGIAQWTVLEGALDQGGAIRVELAWVGPLMYELLWAQGAGSEVYRTGLAGGAQFQMVHHHLGYMVHDAAEWHALLHHARAGGWAMPLHRNNPGFLESCIIEAPELGHFLEYIHPEPAGLAFFNAVARN